MPCYSITVFDTLTSQYPSWVELKAYLESDDGGHFRITDSDNGLALIRYEKGVTNMDLPHSRWFRSVVWNTRDNYIVSLAPPKASSQPCPYQTVDDLSNSKAICTEFLDGFMINCFRMKGDSRIHITSRSKLDASGTFYSSKPFRQLFLEAFLGKTGTLCDLEKEFQETSSTWFEPDLDRDELSAGYSFLVQHKENRVVTPVLDNRVVLIHTHSFSSKSGLIITSGFPTFRDKPNGLRQFTADMELEKLSYVTAVANNKSSFQGWIQRIIDTESWAFQGVVCEDNEGNRWRFRSDKYNAVKTLRGNTASVLERFSQMYVQNLSHKYLEFYPEDTLEFQLNAVAMNQVIQNLYLAYVSLHVLKTATIDTIDKMYLPHLYNLHGIYITQLRPYKTKLVPIDIHEYFCKQPWQRVAFLIRKNKEAYFQATA